MPLINNRLLRIIFDFDNYIYKIRIESLNPKLTVRQFRASKAYLANRVLNLNDVDGKLLIEFNDVKTEDCMYT